ncbi:MAG: sugar phosphate isomerase/epimerase [Clostridia bacterium]|nr:sugar phosphate isomerase/epimerase [Clostridia bacterium]
MIYLSAFADEAARSLKGQIEALKRNSISYSEIRSVDGKNVSKFTTIEAKEYQKEMLDNGIKVWSVGSPLGKVDISVDFLEYLDTVKHVCELANIFDSNKIRMFSFFNAYNEKNKVFDYLNKMVEVASSYGVELCHENEKEVYGDTAERVLEIMDNCKGLKFIYDPVNYIAVGEKASKTLELFHDKTEYFHIKDMLEETGEHVPAGFGDGNIKGLVEKIKDDKVLTLEPHLAIFSGYSAIDNFEMKNKYKFSSNTESFDCATKSLKDILTECGYKEVNVGFSK